MTNLHRSLVEFCLLDVWRNSGRRRFFPSLRRLTVDGWQSSVMLFVYKERKQCRSVPVGPGRSAIGAVTNGPVHHSSPDGDQKDDATRMQQWTVGGSAQDLFRITERCSKWFASISLIYCSFVIRSSVIDFPFWYRSRIQTKRKHGRICSCIAQFVSWRLPMCHPRNFRLIIRHLRFQHNGGRTIREWWMNHSDAANVQMILFVSFLLGITGHNAK